MNGLPVELQHKPKPNANTKTNTKCKPNSNPHGPTIKSTPRAQKENLDKSHENMAIKKIFNKYLIFTRSSQNYEAKKGSCGNGGTHLNL